MKTTKDRWAVFALFCLVIVAAVQLLLPRFVRADVPLCSIGCTCKEVWGYDVVTGGANGSGVPQVFWKWDVNGVAWLVQDAMHPIHTTGGCQEGEVAGGGNLIRNDNCLTCDLACSVVISSVNDSFVVEIAVPPPGLIPPAYDANALRQQEVCLKPPSGGTP